MKLTEKQKRFIDYFVETGNQTEAARLAGYKKPHVQGAQNLDKLRGEIDKKIQELDNKREASAQEVIEYLTSVMRGELHEETIVVEGKGDHRSEAKKISKEPAIKDRNKAAELLGKRFSLFTDKIEHSGSIGVTIVDDIDKD